MKIQVGKTYKIKERSRGKCASFVEVGGKYIKVLAIATNRTLCYDILDEDKDRVDSCYSCFTTNDLINEIPKTLDGTEKEIDGHIYKLKLVRKV